MDASQGLLDRGTPYRVIVGVKGPNDFRQFVDGFLLLIGRIAAARFALWFALACGFHKVVVEHEIVAAGDQQLGCRTADSAAQDSLVVFLELGGQGRKIARGCRTITSHMMSHGTRHETLNPRLQVRNSPTHIIQKGFDFVVQGGESIKVIIEPQA